MNDAQIKERHKYLDLTYKEYRTMKENLSNHKIGPYYICESIGVGAFGEVYKGIDQRSKKQVAVKVLNSREIQAEPNPRVKKIRKRLIQSESKLMMKCDSPNLLKCFEVYENPDLKIMIIQFCNGGNLQDQIDKKKKIPETDAILILKQLLNGIAECHRHNIIHRDLKAQNIMIHNGEYKIADFGFSKQLDIQADNQIGNLTILGTITTMAPQVMGKSPYGLKADIWSIGVIFFQMMFGVIPYKSNTSKELLQQIMSVKLMKNDEFQGIRPSRPVKKFLEEVLVIEQDQRLGWKDLLKHQIFTSQQESGHMSENFRRQVNIGALDQKMGEIQKNQQWKKGLTQSQYSQNFPIQQEVQYQTTVGKSKMKKITAQELMKIKEDLNKDQDRAYKWAKKYHVQCKKTEYILKNIIEPLQSKEKKLLNLSQRADIEMIFLICTRCLNNIAPINQEAEKKKKDVIVQDLHDSVKKIYTEVTKKWNFYSKKLTDFENKIGSILSDWTKKLTDGENLKRKDRFLTGYENFQEFKNQSMIEKKTVQEIRAEEERKKTSKIKIDDNLIDYDKKEQIVFTVSYINNYLNQNKQIKAKDKFIADLRSNLQHYQDINMIEDTDLKNRKFHEHVALLLK